MEKTLNKVELKGRVGADPKVTEMEGGVSLIRFSLATHEVFKGKDGQYKEETMWHSIAAWSSKGMPDFSKIRKGVFVELSGRLRYYSYMGKDGQERYSCEIVALKMSLPEND
ncbi:MAG: single-stranded DNA-binding protein [Bacteroidales bacterium]|nr:single-stranded DNA-binding protein [Bacteroidales bacterium]